MIYEFIKDFENNIQTLESSEKIRLRNFVVHQLNKFSNRELRLTDEDIEYSMICAIVYQVF